LPEPIQDAGATTALVAANGIKGKFALSLDETVVPTQQALDLADSPYTEVMPVAMHQRQPAIAAVSAYFGARAGQNSLLMIDSVLVENETGAALDYEMRTLSGAAVEALNLFVTAAGLRLNGLFVAAAIPRAAAQQIRGNDAVIGGSIIARFSVPANDAKEIKIGRGLTLLGNDPIQPALTVWNTTVNSPVAGTFWAREFKLKG